MYVYTYKCIESRMYVNLMHLTLQRPSLEVRALDLSPNALIPRLV